VNQRFIPASRVVSLSLLSRAPRWGCRSAASLLVQECRDCACMARSRQHPSSPARTRRMWAYIAEAPQTASSSVAPESEDISGCALSSLSVRKTTCVKVLVEFLLDATIYIGLNSRLCLSRSDAATNHESCVEVEPTIHLWIYVGE